MKKSVFFFCFVFLALEAGAQLRLARLFSDHAVLQRQKPIPVWGWTTPGEQVTVALAGKTQQARADNAGKWQVSFASMEAGGPYTLTVTSASGKLRRADLPIGDMWLGSGQSDM